MKHNRISLMLLAMALVLSLCGCGGASTAESVEPVQESVTGEPVAEESVAAVASVPEEDGYDEVFAVVHTNDVHGFIEVEPYVKGVADALKEEYGQENVVTVSAGDVYAGGNAVAHLYKGELIPPIMDAAGYDLLVPGNNDFNLGLETLLSLSAAGSHVKTISGNLFELLDDGTGGETYFEPTAVFTTAGGAKVGFFGVSISGGSIADLCYNPGSVETAQTAVDALTEEGCGVIIGIGHTGWDDDLVTPSSNDTTSAALVKAVPGIDAYVDGHTHSIIGEGSGWVCPETGTLVNQANCKGAAIGVMTFYLKDGVVAEKEARLISQEELASYTPDPDTQALVDAAYERLSQDAGDAYVISEYFLNGLRTADSTDGRSIRTHETNLGDLITDAMRAATGADIALMPGYRIRSSVSEGPITAVSLYDVFANGADIYVQEMTGQEVLDKMASSLIDLPNESTQFNQWSGASYGYIAGENKSFTIVNPMVGGEPLDLEKTYLVAMDLGGPDAPEDQDPLISGMEAMAESFGAYLASPECVIYPDVVNPDNRIVPMTEVPEGAVTYEVTAAMSPPPDGVGGGSGEVPPGGFGGGGEAPPDGFGGGETPPA